MDAAGARRQSAGWPWIALIWSGIGLFDATQTVLSMRAEGMHHNWGRLFVTILLSWLLWVLATPVVLRAMQYAPLPSTSVTNWAIHLVVCAAIGFISSAWIAWLENLLDPWAKVPATVPFVQLWLHKFYGGLLLFLMLYSFVLVVSYGLGSRERLARQQMATARLNEQLTKAQLDALRRQVEPHFLFNALNAVAGLVREQRHEAAISMIAELSDLMRRALADSNRQQVPLGEEIEFLQKYLAIQKMRFADRLRLTVDVPKGLFTAQVPSLILQLMVENAVKHGIAKIAEGGAVRIAACRSNDMLRLEVYNDGPALPANWEDFVSGIGIANMRSRLHGLYGDRFELTMRNQAPGGVEVSVSVPFQGA